MTKFTRLFVLTAVVQAGCRGGSDLVVLLDETGDGGFVARHLPDAGGGATTDSGSHNGSDGGIVFPRDAGHGAARDAGSTGRVDAGNGGRTDAGTTTWRDAGSNRAPDAGIDESDASVDVGVDAGACGPGLARCGGSCVNLSTSASHCGQCDNPCATP
ncbi:MAG: hypothetical protein HYY84_00455, partial [Deltaproteobacteria bacterium]|nr:hypothetical protein [Deltaproteobacteria bacterium]